jgi:4'-phosphopantetheinyl transferase
VDVESADCIPDLAIADKIFSSDESHDLESAPAEEQRALFFRLWTFKEAFIKATGEGLKRPLRSFSFKLDPVQIRFHLEEGVSLQHGDPAGWQFAEYRPSPHHHLALAIQQPSFMPLRLNLRAVQPAEVALL